METYLMAFLIGGAICVIGQLLMDLTPLTPAHVLVVFVVAGAILSGLGMYQPLVDIGGAGATVPLPGFGHAMTSGILEDMKEYGFWGIFSGAFRAAAIGLTAAVFFGFLMAVIFDPKG